MANTEFSPFNNIVKLCLQGMEKEEQGKPEDASKIFLQSWNEATNDFEKFLSAYFVARHQKTASDKLKWLEASLLFAIKVNDNTVKSAFPALYSNMAKCYEDLNTTLPTTDLFIMEQKQICRLEIYSQQVEIPTINLNSE
jgi:rifampin ADP-ribosylating transferase